MNTLAFGVLALAILFPGDLTAGVLAGALAMRITAAEAKP